MKYDFDRYDYYVVHIQNNQELTTNHHRIGELSDYYVLKTLKTLHKRAVAINHVEKLEPKSLYKKEVPLKDSIFKRESELLKGVRTRLNITDPGFGSQWHLLNVNHPTFDMNITGVWEQGITGKGVTVGFLDDGLDHDHPDLKDNFSLEGSYDFNEHKKLPTPALYDDTHGTRCAGEVAAVRNDVCGIGVAYESKVAGIRILSGTLTSADEAAAVNYAYQTTQIYSCSWGPRDDGRTMENPPLIVSEAMKNGIEKGRQGLGSIFVFAAGNGGGSGDNWYHYFM